MGKSPLRRGEKERGNAREMINWSGKNLFTFNDRALGNIARGNRRFCYLFYPPSKSFRNVRKDNNNK